MNTFETMLKHPIATVIVASCVIGGITDGIARIIGVTNGNEVKPMINVQIGTMKSEEE